MAGRSNRASYYYANGKKVRLVPAAGLVAVNEEEMAEALSTSAAVNEVRNVSRQLRGGVALVRQEDLADETAVRLRDRNAAHPVFEAEGALIVPLPEVRIEDQDEAKLDEVRQWLEQNAGDVEIVSERQGRIQVRPVSNDPEDALQIANRVTEEVGPTMAQTRFIRCVKRPT